MLQLLPKQLERITFYSSKTLAGEVCRIIEEFKKNDKNLNDDNTIKLLKELVKNKIFESGRYQKNLIEELSKSLITFNLNCKKPTDNK